MKSLEIRIINCAGLLGGGAECGQLGVMRPAYVSLPSPNIPCEADRRAEQGWAEEEAGAAQNTVGHPHIIIHSHCIVSEISIE